MQPDLEILETQDGEWLRLRLVGELDLASAPVLSYRLEQLRAERRPVRLDLSGLDFIDSSGIRLLVSAFNDARSNGWRLEVAPGLSPQAANSLRLARLQRLITGRDSDVGQPASQVRRPD